MEVRNLEANKRSSLPLEASQTERLVFVGGFTLIEMMVVIGLIAIVVCGAVPGLRKLYQDFKINETYDHVNTLVSSYVNHYLVKNEFLEDCPSDTHIRTWQAWCLPGSYYDRTADSVGYKLNEKPYQADAYDVDNWLQTQGKAIITIRRSNNTLEWIARLQKKFPMYDIWQHNTNNICISPLPGLEKFATESAEFRDRFY